MAMGIISNYSSYDSYGSYAMQSMAGNGAANSTKKKETEKASETEKTLEVVEISKSKSTTDYVNERKGLPHYGRCMERPELLYCGSPCMVLMKFCYSVIIVFCFDRILDHV